MRRNSVEREISLLAVKLVSGKLLEGILGISKETKLASTVGKGNRFVKVLFRGDLNYLAGRRIDSEVIEANAEK